MIGISVRVRERQAKNGKAEEVERKKREGKGEKWRAVEGDERERER